MVSHSLPTVIRTSVFGQTLLQLPIAVVLLRQSLVRCSRINIAGRGVAPLGVQPISHWRATLAPFPRKLNFYVESNKATVKWGSINSHFP